MNDKTEFLNIGDLPETLLVLGNGFDLTCKVPSDYKKFLEYILEQKLNFYSDELQKYGFSNIFEYTLSEIERYLKDTNFANDKAIRKSGVVPELNSWYIIFLYRKLTNDTDWFQVENQIASQLTANDNSMNIVESIGDSLLSIYQNGKYMRRSQRISYLNNKEIEKIYELLSYNLLKKQIGPFKDKGYKDLFIEFRKKVKELWKEYYELWIEYFEYNGRNIGSRIDREKFEDTFESKLEKELFPMVAQVLLAELKELEMDFREYLTSSISHMGYTYEENAGNLIESILKKIGKDTENSTYNVLTFNYTTPWDMYEKRNLGEDPHPIFKGNPIKTLNLHGRLDSWTQEIIFGVDDEFLSPLSNEYIFTKTSRTLDLYTKGMFEEWLNSSMSEILSPSIKEIVFFGHSLSKADYGYFRKILDNYVDNPEAHFIFVYNVYKGTTSDKKRRELIQSISSLFGEYSINKQSNTDIFRDLIQNNRIKIVEL
ncbi:AbiH family protein [Streptococcus salivarius]|uniref:AbiH family protein n=1 Tax=Streptococcus salivarius TaxID=1304 RepID=UPI00093F8C11|nr:AbiH family protein [Streptococcus salivarius]